MALVLVIMIGKTILFDDLFKSRNYKLVYSKNGYFCFYCKSKVSRIELYFYGQSVKEHFERFARRAIRHSKFKFYSYNIKIVNSRAGIVCVTNYFNQLRSGAPGAVTNDVFASTNDPYRYTILEIERLHGPGVNYFDTRFSERPDPGVERNRKIFRAFYDKYRTYLGKPLFAKKECSFYILGTNSGSSRRIRVNKFDRIRLESITNAFDDEWIRIVFRADKVRCYEDLLPAFDFKYLDYLADHFYFDDPLKGLRLDADIFRKIQNGIIEKGMNKTEIVLALGEPGFVAENRLIFDKFIVYLSSDNICTNIHPNY